MYVIREVQVVCVHVSAWSVSVSVRALCVPVSRFCGAVRVLCAMCERLSLTAAAAAAARVRYAM